MIDSWTFDFGSRVFVLPHRAYLIRSCNIICLQYDLPMTTLITDELYALNKLSRIIALQICPHVVVAKAIENTLTRNLLDLHLLGLFLLIREVNHLNPLYSEA